MPMQGASADVLGALRRERLAASLAALLGSADAAVADDLLALGDWVRVAGGERLFREGDPGDSLYLVVAGRLVASCEDRGGRRRVVGQIRPGETVGEMGLLAHQPRSATVHAVRDSVAIRISDAAFQRVVASHPGLVTSTARVVVRRTAELLRGLGPVERPKTIAVVPLRRSVRSAELVERLRRALARRGRTQVIDRARADAALAASGVSAASAEDARDLALSAWLDAEELCRDALLLETEEIADPWTERCARQADVVLLVAPAGESADGALDEARRVCGDGARRELVLVHPPGAAPPSGTGRALREVGIPIDAVGGASQGAIVAAAVAMDWDDAAIERLHRDGFTHRNPIGDYALLPLLALAKGGRVDAALQRGFGDRAIEDTWRSFFCVSANLTLARAEVHRRGPLWRALRASVSIPGLLPPAVIGEHLHVDGGILDNLPIEAMRESGVGRIVAVDLSVQRETSMRRSALPSSLELLRDRLRPDASRPRSPGLGAILVRAAMMSSMQRARAMRPGVDLYLEPRPAEIGFLDWKALDRGIELGYRYAREELARGDVSAWVDVDQGAGRSGDAP
jgi:predicted acylesterase/phospholipase RssA/CRP-like cAMP-binding protein